MRRRICILLLAGATLLPPATALQAAGPPAGKQPTRKPKPPATQAAISREDRQVIAHMELLKLMDLLQDMPLLEGKTKAVPEEKK